MTHDLTTLEIIGVAIKSEENAEAFYKSLASKINNNFVKSKYKTLASEEKMHRDILVNLYKDIVGKNEEPPTIPGKKKTAEDVNKDLVGSIEDILKCAIKKEVEAREFYANAAQKTNNQNSKRLLEYLADMERGHALMLETELKAYERDKTWYADNPDVQLVGP